MYAMERENQVIKKSICAGTTEVLFSTTELFSSVYVSLLNQLTRLNVSSGVEEAESAPSTYHNNTAHACEVARDKR